MNLDDLKNEWSRYDKHLGQNLKLNEALIRRMNLRDSGKGFRKLLIFDFLNVIIASVVVIYFTLTAVQLWSEPVYSIMSFFCALAGATFLIFSIIRLSSYLHIDFINFRIVRLQKEISNFQKLMMTLRKIEMMLLPFLLMALMPVLFKLLFNINIFDRLHIFISVVISTLLITLPFGIWYNKQADQKISHTLRMIDELERFEKE
jgi:hypothetical protein